MSIIGWYYLHENGSLIYKPGSDSASDIRESDVARALWSIDPASRSDAWTILVEALAAGANPERVQELAVKWQCDDEDAQEFSSRIGCRLQLDGNQWCATREDFIDLVQSPAGFGHTALGAMSALCKELGYRPAKMWGVSFSNLLKEQP